MCTFCSNGISFIVIVLFQSQRFTSTCIEGLQLIVHILCIHFKSELTRFLNSLGEFNIC